MARPSNANIGPDDDVNLIVIDQLPRLRHDQFCVRLGVLEGDFDRKATELAVLLLDVHLKRLPHLFGGLRDDPRERQGDADLEGREVSAPVVAAPLPVVADPPESAGAHAASKPNPRRIASSPRLVTIEPPGSSHRLVTFRRDHDSMPSGPTADDK